MATKKYDDAVTGAQNAIIGEQNPMATPETTVPEDVLVEEKKMARYSRTAEFKRLSDFMNDRIKFFQSYLPDGRPIKDVNLPEDMFAANWKAANIVIGEFKNILNEYEQAHEAVNGPETD